MTIKEFKDYVKTGHALSTEEIHLFMDEMSNAARRITFRLNAAYHTPAEVRKFLSELFGYEVPASLRVFPLCKTYQFFLLIENKRLTKIVSLINQRASIFCNVLH